VVLLALLVAALDHVRPMETVHKRRC
jgi:hypothetical protein